MTHAPHQQRTVFELNSDAIRELQVGRHSHAIVKLQAAMRWLRAIVHDPARSGFQLVPIEGYGGQINNDSIETVSILSVPADEDQGDAPTLHANHSDTLFQLFDMAFTTIFLDYEGQKGLRLTTSFILYNLGLCYHHREVTKGTMNPDRLRTALKCYTKALRILDGAVDDGRFEDMNLLLLAIFNNMGCLFAYLGDIEECGRCIYWIRNMLSSIEFWNMAHTRDDVAFFYQNSLFVMDNMFDKAAAA